MLLNSINQVKFEVLKSALNLHNEPDHSGFHDCLSASFVAFMRCSRGRITVWHRGGGHRKLYRKIDFKRRREGRAVVDRLEYDPNRSATIALLTHDSDGHKTYIICPKGLAIGEEIFTGQDSPIKRGTCMALKMIPVGTKVHNIELTPGKGGQLVRSAGSSATLVRTRSDGYSLLRLRSGEQRLVHGKCKATIGTVSNDQHQNRVVGKAGINRLKGWRPVTRGVAMNPGMHYNCFLIVTASGFHAGALRDLAVTLAIE